MHHLKTLFVFAAVIAGGCAASDDDSVWSSSVRQLVISEGGGYDPPVVTTPDCPGYGEEFTLSVGDRTVSGWSCSDEDSPGTLQRHDGTHVLTPAELDALISTLRALKVVHLDTCGADKPEVTLQVTTSSSTTEYGDAFYSCQGDPRPHVDTDALDAAGDALFLLAFSDQPGS